MNVSFRCVRDGAAMREKANVRLPYVIGRRNRKVWRQPRLEGARWRRRIGVSFRCVGDSVAWRKRLERSRVSRASRAAAFETALRCVRIGAPIPGLYWLAKGQVLPLPKVGGRGLLASHQRLFSLSAAAAGNGAWAFGWRVPAGHACGRVRRAAKQAWRGLPQMHTDAHGWDRGRRIGAAARVRLQK